VQTIKYSSISIRPTDNQIKSTTCTNCWIYRIQYTTWRWATNTSETCEGWL